jgi:hypothetical protein
MGRTHQKKGKQKQSGKREEIKELEKKEQRTQEEEAGSVDYEKGYNVTAEQSLESFLQGMNNRIHNANLMSPQDFLTFIS